MDTTSTTVESDEWAWSSHQARLDAVYVSESDRAAALLAGAFLDEHLKRAISRALVKHDKVSTLLLEERGPLSTFSSRIDMAFALGMLTEPLWRELHVVRKIRNDFAHHAEALTFQTDSIKDRCATLQGPCRYTNKIPIGDARGNYLQAISFAVFVVGFAHKPHERPAIPSEINLAEVFGLL